MIWDAEGAPLQILILSLFLEEFPLAFEFWLFITQKTCLKENLIL